jgi:hypothetical protein
MCVAIRVYAYIYIYIYIYIINDESYLTIYAVYLRSLTCQIKKDYESLDISSHMQGLKLISDE